MEFEKYLTPECKMNKEHYIKIPVYEYILMQFIDFSYYKSYRNYFFKNVNTDLNIDFPVGTVLYKEPNEPHSRFPDFIKTFGVLFNV